MNPYYPAPTSGYIGPSYGPQPGVVAGFQNYYQYCNLSQSLPKEKTTGAEKEKKKEKNLRVGGMYCFAWKSLNCVLLLFIVLFRRQDMGR